MSDTPATWYCRVAALDKEATIAGEPRLALALLCGSEPGNTRLQEYWPH